MSGMVLGEYGCPLMYGYYTLANGCARLFPRYVLFLDWGDQHGWCRQGYTNHSHRDMRLLTQGGGSQKLVVYVAVDHGWKF
jgi:hypothetical protein